MLHRLMEAGLARQRDPDGVKFRPVIELTAAGIAVMKGEQLPPAPLIDLLPQTFASSGTNPRAMGTNPAGRARIPGAKPDEIDEDSSIRRCSRVSSDCAQACELARDSSFRLTASATIARSS